MKGINLHTATWTVIAGNSGHFGVSSEQEHTPVRPTAVAMAATERIHCERGEDRNSLVHGESTGGRFLPVYFFKRPPAKDHDASAIASLPPKTDRTVLTTATHNADLVPDA